MRIHFIFSFGEITIQTMTRIKNMKNTQDKHTFPKTEFVLLPRTQTSKSEWSFSLGFDFIFLSPKAFYGTYLEWFTVKTNLEM